MLGALGGAEFREAGEGGEGLEALENQAGVQVDVATDGEERDATVLDAQGGNVWSGLNWRLDLCSKVVSARKD